jgi:hypothetical protein
VACALFVTVSHAAQPLHVTGQYVEGCSCIGVCPCELTCVLTGCEGVYGVKIASGACMGTDLSGSKIAMAGAPAR